MTKTPFGAVRAVVSDVDGTLVTSAKILTDRSRQAVAALRARGIAFAIVSSRPPRGLKALIEPLGLTTPIAGFNGGIIAHPDLSVISQVLISPDVAAQTVDQLTQLGVDVWVFARGEWFLTNPQAPHVDTELRAVQFGPTHVPEFGDTLLIANKIVGVSRDHALLARAEPELQAVFGTTATVVRSQAYYLDITPPDANKGAAVIALARLMGVPMHEVAVLGDGANDVAMFVESPLSIAMGNATAEVKSRARFVTASNEDDGFAEAIERYVLGTRSFTSTESLP